VGAHVARELQLGAVRAGGQQHAVAIDGGGSCSLGAESAAHRSHVSHTAAAAGPDLKRGKHGNLAAKPPQLHVRFTLRLRSGSAVVASVELRSLLCELARRHTIAAGGRGGHVLAQHVTRHSCALLESRRYVLQVRRGGADFGLTRQSSGRWQEAAQGEGAGDDEEPKLSLRNRKWRLSKLAATSQ
jgi:hypothetical protein